MSNFQLEIGKSYRLRNGAEITIQGEHQPHNFPFYPDMAKKTESHGWLRALFFNASGRTAYKVDREWDIVEELTIDPSVQPS